MSALGHNPFLQSASQLAMAIVALTIFVQYPRSAAAQAQVAIENDSQCPMIDLTRTPYRLDANENANIDLALTNLDDIQRATQQAKKPIKTKVKIHYEIPHDGRPTTKVDDPLEIELGEIIALIRENKEAGRILSVPDLKKGKKLYEGTGDQAGSTVRVNRKLKAVSPHAYACIRGTLLTNAQNQNEGCPEGTILLDRDLIHTRIVLESPQKYLEKAKLSSLLVHEKAHELLLRKAAASATGKGQTPAGQPYWDARAQAITEDAHEQVYDLQSQVVDAENLRMRKQKFLKNGKPNQDVQPQDRENAQQGLEKFSEELHVRGGGTRAGEGASTGDGQESAGCGESKSSSKPPAPTSPGPKLALLDQLQSSQPSAPSTVPNLSYFPNWPVSYDSTVLCNYFHATPYPMTFSPADGTGNPLVPSPNYNGASTDYGGTTTGPYSWYVNRNMPASYPGVPSTQSSSLPTTPVNDYLKPDYSFKPDYGVNYNYPRLFQDSSRNWGIKYDPLIKDSHYFQDIAGGYIPGSKAGDGANNPAAGTGGGNVPITIDNSTIPDNWVPTPRADADSPPNSTTTTDSPSPQTGGLTTYFFKGPEIKKETGTAEQGQSVSLNTQPTQPFRVKLTGPSYELPFGTSYQNNPQTWEAQRLNFWNRGVPLMTIVRLGETSTIQTATNDPILGLPSATGNLNLNFSVNVDNPQINGYIVTPQPGTVPDFTGQIGGNVVGLGYFHPDGGPSVLWRGPTGNLNSWSYLTTTNSWGFTSNFTGATGAGDFKFDARTDVIPNSAFGLRYLELEEPLTFGNRSFFPLYGANYNPGPKLTEQFGGNVTTNFCWGTLPGPWEPANASYAPGSDVPSANVTLRRLARAGRAIR